MDFSSIDFAFPEEQYEALIRIVKRRTGMDLRGYRESVARRRVARRARSIKCKDISEYIEFLTRNHDEADALVKLVTIQVSQFFRNPEVFDLLSHDVLPRIYERKARGEGVTAWSAGCAEGEEAYSIAILFLKQYGGMLHEHPVKVIGTDVSAQSIAAAKEGRYEEDKVALVDDSLKRRYFRYREGKWEVKLQVRNFLDFRLENLFTGAGAPGSDLVVARNLLIYFDRERQEALLGKLSECLSPGGYLVLGKSETLPAHWRDAMRPVASRERVYRKA